MQGAPRALVDQGRRQVREGRGEPAPAGAVQVLVEQVERDIDRPLTVADIDERRDKALQRMEAAVAADAAKATSGAGDDAIKRLEVLAERMTAASS